MVFKDGALLDRSLIDVAQDDFAEYIEPITADSTLPVAETRRHAGIVRVERYRFALWGMWPPGIAIFGLSVFVCHGVCYGMAKRPDDYIVTRETDARPHPWRWEIRRRSKLMGIKLGAGGYQSPSAVEYAGSRALADFLRELAKEEQRK